MIRWSAKYAVATMVATACSELPGVVAAGAPQGDPQSIYVVMKSDRGYRIMIMQILEVEGPEYVPYIPEGDLT